MECLDYSRKLMVNPDINVIAMDSRKNTTLLLYFGFTSKIPCPLVFDNG